MNRRYAARALVLLTVLVAVPRLPAQAPASTHFVTWRPEAAASAVWRPAADSAAPSANASGMTLGGIAGVAVGYMAGGLLSALVACIDTPYDDGDCELGAFVIGGLIASTVTIPIGVHMGNHGRGDLSRDLLVSAAIGAVGLGAAAATENGTVFLFTPLAQVIASIWMEERTMHKTPSADASH